MVVVVADGRDEGKSRLETSERMRDEDNDDMILSDFIWKIWGREAFALPVLLLGCASA